MTDPSEKTLERQIRAFHWVRLLSEIPTRPGGAAAAAEAAHRIEAWLREIGIEEVENRPAGDRASTALSVALHLGLGAVACVLSGLLGSALAGFVAVSFHREARGRPLLSRWLPTLNLQNVIGRVGATSPSQRVVLSARIDAAARPSCWESVARWMAERIPYGRRRLDPDVVPGTLLWLGAASLLVGWLGADALLVRGATALIGLGLAAGTVLTLLWDRVGTSSSRQLRASAAAAMLTATEQLLAQLPEGVELWMVGCGGERFGGAGLRSFVEAHTDWPVEASYFVHFEPVGRGPLHYDCGAGSSARSDASPTLLELARRVSESGVFGELSPSDRFESSEVGIAADAGFPTLFLVAQTDAPAGRGEQPERGAPGAVDMPTVIRAADFGAAAARAALRREAGPIAIL